MYQCETDYFKRLKYVISKLYNWIDVIFVKQASEKCNLAFENEKIYEIEILTCGTDYLEMCNDYSKEWNMYFKIVELKYMWFLWNMFHDI